MSRVTIDYTAGAQQGAGIGRYTRELVQALGRLDTTTTYTLLVRGDIRVAGSVDGFPANFRLRRIPIANRTFLRLWRTGVPLAGEWLAGAADVYYSPDFTLPPLRGGRAAVTIHDLSFLRVPETADAGLRAYLSAAVPRAVTRADHVFADSAHTRQDLIDLLGVPPDRISVLLSATSPHFRRVEDAAALAEVRARYGLDGPFILGLGTLEPRKNLARLMEAFARLRAEGVAHHLILVGGRGWLDDPIFAHVERLGLRDSARFLGYVPDADLPALYSLADAFAFPSLYEGFGLPPLEALACGTPTVVSDTSSLPEVVGDAALLVPPTDVDALAAALRRLLDDAALGARLRVAGPSRAASFSWDTAARQLQATLLRLAQGI